MSLLYACLRSPQRPDVAVAVAKEFSPRLQRYGSDCVVLDVGGLERLLGEPQAIGEEIAEQFDRTRIADFSDGTRITRIAGLSHGTQIARISSDLSRGTPISSDHHNVDPRRSASREKDLRRSAQSASRDDLKRSAESASREKDPRSRVAIAPTQIGAMLLSSAHPGLTVVTGDIASALAPVRLEVLRQVLAEIRGVTMLREADPPGSARSAFREDQQSARSAFREDQQSARSASREDQKSARSASREDLQQSAKSASGKGDPRTSASRDHRSVKSASREENQRSEKAFETLQRWGLTTLGELAALPAGPLSARLGQAGLALQRMACGVDASPLVPDPDVPRFLEHIELEWPIEGLEPLAFVLARLLEPLSSALERADRGAAAIHLELRLVDRTRHTRVLQLPAAMRDAKVLRTLLVLDLESHPPPAAVDIVAIEVDPAPGRVLQYSLLERARPSVETLATLTARLGALVGESRCGHPVLLDSHGPDAFEMRRFAPDESVAATSPADSSVVVSGFSRTRTSPAEAGHYDSAVLRRFRPPIAIRVAVERGRPRHVAIDRRGMPGGHVEQCAGPWRSSGAWWKDRGKVRGKSPGRKCGESGRCRVGSPGSGTAMNGMSPSATARCAGCFRHGTPSNGFSTGSLIDLGIDLGTELAIESAIACGD